MGGIKSVRSVVKTQFHDIVVEDTALAIVEYNNGAVGVIEELPVSILPRIRGLRFIAKTEALFSAMRA